MIEIVNTHNLKNITQIGIPGTDEEKIYVEDSVYTRIHVDEFREKRVFVFMGHTECENGRYKTFVEGVIPVYDIEFTGGIPNWNTHAWSEVFREIKRKYTDFIIVGWALDQRGIKPSATAELEAVHREHFGGLHQLLFLMDTMAGDESFYILRSNRLYPKTGFYIFYSTVKTPVPEPVDLEVEWIKPGKSYTVTRIQDEPKETQERVESSRGYYRKLLQENQQIVPQRKKRNPVAAMVVLCLLVGIAGVAVSKNQNAVKDIQTWVSGVVDVNTESGESAQSSSEQGTGSENVQRGSEQAIESESTQVGESQSATAGKVPEIPVEKVDGGIETGN